MRDIIEINSILRDFNTISGMRISIHDTEFNEIYSYPKEPNPFCKCLQANETVKSDCHSNDHAAFKKVRETGEVYVYKCRRGLYEAVAPLYRFGTLSGYLMIGQICDESTASKEYLVKSAAKILGDYTKAEEISKTVKTVDKDTISSYINIMIVLAEYLTRTNKLAADNEKLPQQIKEYINKNYQSKITLDVLSQKFACCNTTLTKAFKNEFGYTIMSYVFELRLKKAEELIVKTRRSFKEIAAECGFYDQNYFSKLFTKTHGCSPSVYRQKND